MNATVGTECSMLAMILEVVLGPDHVLWAEALVL